MPVTVPVATNYPSPLNAVPTKYAGAPPEGSKIIDCEIDWATMGGSNKTVFFNLQNNATLNFSQIVALSVDNSACGADVQFIFPDTMETLTIPAYTPWCVVPVFTNQTQFYVTSPNAESEDITRFGIQNTLPPPIAVPTTQEQNAAASGAIAITGGPGSPTQLVDAGIDGTLESVSISCSLTSTSSNGNLITTLEDGNGNVISIAGVAIAQASVINVLVLSLPDIKIRFRNGLKLAWANTDISSGAIYVNLYYRTP